MGVDQEKDQSYVLHVLTQQHLAHVLFPVGGLAKPVVRQMAAERGLPVAGRHDSQDLCFLADGDYRRFLRDWAPPDAIAPGAIVNSAGTSWASIRACLSTPSASARDLASQRASRCSCCG